jgi:hypothetical protein
LQLGNEANIKKTLFCTVPKGRFMLDPHLQVLEFFGLLSLGSHMKSLYTILSSNTVHRPPPVLLLSTVAMPDARLLKIAAGMRKSYLG